MASVALGASGDGVLDTNLVSRAGGAAGAPGADHSSDPSISANGRYVALTSAADNLDPASNDTVVDVFVRDLQANTITLVSRAGGAAGAAGDSDSGAASISADGRYVAFYSEAGNLDAASDDAVGDVFVRDLKAHTTTLASRATGAAGAVGDGASFDPSISADGRHVAFQTGAGNLDSASNDAVSDVFVRDLDANATALASRAGGAAGAAGDDGSSDPTISADGRRVAFSSEADNLDSDSDDSFRDAFVRDLDANTTTLVDRAGGAAGAAGDAGASGAAISADGHRVAFASESDNLDPESDDVVGDVFVRDLEAKTTTLASRATGAAGAVGHEFSQGASISADGRRVAFSSNDDLDPDATPAAKDVFVRDLEAKSTILVSRASGAAGVGGDAASLRPSISAAGRRVAFHSDADNLDPNSNDAVTDVFVRELLDPRCAAGRIATKVGTSGRDKLRGTPGRDVIAGLGGNDVIRGLAGNDVLCGGAGRDRVLGGQGRDKLLGQNGRDRLRGGPGRDRLRGGPGRNIQIQ
jgi:Tol biopolymer transport system component